MRRNNSFDSLYKLFKVKHFFVKLHYRKQIVHGGIGSIELIIYHIQLLCCQWMLCMKGSLIDSIEINTILPFMMLGIQLPYFFRSSSTENITCIKSSQITFITFGVNLKIIGNIFKWDD